VPSLDGPGPGERRSAAGSARRRRIRPGNLPTQLSPFIGRRQEIAQLKPLLTASRLVTLTGTGGVGKTRLAVRVAAEARRTFADGAWFVDLTRVQDSQLPDAEVRDPDAIAHLVLTALGMPQRAGGSAVESLAGYLLDRRVLLVLDNCERVSYACAVLVEELLATCAGVRLLATSREPLAVGGEILYPVPPLPVPDPHRAQSLEDLAGCESVALFSARVQALAPDFAVTEHNQDSVAELCRRLDGLPLAIELAAARARMLTPQQILERLNHRFALLSAGRRDAPARQQTLRACVQWSLELCSKPERLLCARLSVFVGGFDLEAVEHVCTDDDLLPVRDVVDVLASLVDKSIVDRLESDDPGAPIRYRLLETIRDYGREQLIEAGEQTAVRGSHRDWYQQLMAAAGTDWTSCRQSYWRARLAADYPNLCAAIELCLSTPGDAGRVLPIVESLPRGFWVSGRVASEGLSWLNRSLAQAPAPTVARARALVLVAGLALHRQDLDTMTRRLEDGQRLARRVHDDYALAVADYTKSVAAYQRNDLADATDFAEKGLAQLPPGPEPNLSLRLHLLMQLLWATALSGDHDRSRRCYREIQEITESRGEIGSRSAAMLGIGLVSWRAGQTAEADQHARASLRLRQATRSIDLFVCGQDLELLAWTAAGQQRYPRAATLLGAADRALADRGTPISTLKALVADHARCERRIREVLDTAAFTRAFGHGQSLSIADAVAYALDQRPALKRPPPAACDPSITLTRREREIAGLIAEGLSNQELAARLVISPRTVEGHVQHILIKLGFASRSQVAAWITDSTA
jgi:predicted ATPase/DNA-binding NarL/FixJ family response regulator